MIGFFIGLVLGVFAGVAVACLAVMAGRSDQEAPPPPDAQPSNWIDEPAAMCPHGIDTDLHCARCVEGWKA